MCAVAKRFLSGCAATAERHSFFHWKFVSVSIYQLYFSRHDVRAVLDCLDCYLSHSAILAEVDRVVLNTMSSRRRSRGSLASSSEKPIHLDFSRASTQHTRLCTGKFLPSGLL